MKKVLAIVLVVLAFCTVLCSCGSSSSSSSRSDYYSDTYKNDSEYRKNVGNIADAYGKSEQEVDAVINALAGK